jgi:hypothetical protein
MNNTIHMSASFETEKNRKAFAYTGVICGVLFLIMLISWDLPQQPPKVLDDLIEINLGNEEEGMGEVQPLIKGEKSPSTESVPEQKIAAPKAQAAEEVKTNDAADEESAPVTKPAKTPVKVPTPAVVVAPPAPKPQKPKIAGYNGPTGGTGNGATEDNGYKMQGNKPGGTGDAGSPNGKPDSYGNSPGGRTGGGGLRVSKGDRRIVNNYIFMGDLPKATINAVIKVSPEGRGTFVTFDKGSTSVDSKYANAIRGYLPNIEFNKSDHESIVTVPFNFRVQ